jgi:hypothetical protein
MRIQHHITLSVLTAALLLGACTPAHDNPLLDADPVALKSLYKAFASCANSSYLRAGSAPPEESHRWIKRCSEGKLSMAPLVNIKGNITAAHLRDPAVFERLEQLDPEFVKPYQTLKPWLASTRDADATEQR